ncbi:hypothetical protein V1507DRAFT_466808 [Lipomyces tetrasporus]
MQPPKHLRTSCRYNFVGSKTSCFLILSSNSTMKLIYLVALFSAVLGVTAWNPLGKRSEKKNDYLNKRGIKVSNSEEANRHWLIAHARGYDDGDYRVSDYHYDNDGRKDRNNGHDNDGHRDGHNDHDDYGRVKRNDGHDNDGHRDGHNGHDITTATEMERNDGGHDDYGRVKRNDGHDNDGRRDGHNGHDNDDGRRDGHSGHDNDDGRRDRNNDHDDYGRVKDRKNDKSDGKEQKKYWYNGRWYPDWYPYPPKDDGYDY